MADAVIMDDNGGVRDPNALSAAGPMGIRREEPIGVTQIPMDELKDPAMLGHRIQRKLINDVTVTVGGTPVVSQTSPTNVTVIGRANTHPPHDVTFTVENDGRDVLVSSTEALTKPKAHAYKTGKNAIIRSVVVNGVSHPLTGNLAAIVTVTYV